MPLERSTFVVVSVQQPFFRVIVFRLFLGGGHIFFVSVSDEFRVIVLPIHGLFFWFFLFHDSADLQQKAQSFVFLMLAIFASTDFGETMLSRVKKSPKR